MKECKIKYETYKIKKENWNNEKWQMKNKMENKYDIWKFNMKKMKDEHEKWKRKIKNEIIKNEI